MGFLSSTQPTTYSTKLGLYPETVGAQSFAPDSMVTKFALSEV
ncbi:hypothetical protein MC7420_4281 [Coleofasciculus chthonoplastes PCC 7420]|uniref:Uncharacterized protein n=1 Tax=Coleofasciculus chthonoplastes PCC 7420 TaxID=118168 RepID=B4W3Z8_9CYAN|nr:hypothetical protein MC7420_4281 [Coleofasciculus chthonoplastes PCC 7420]